MIKANKKNRELIRNDGNYNIHSQVAKNSADLVTIHVTQYMDNSMTSIPQAVDRNKRPLKSVSCRQKGKGGRIRKNLMGKRVNYSARTVITPDPNMSIDELGIPLKIAMNLTIPEIVTEDNIDEMRQLVKNARDIYPGANFLTFGSNAGSKFESRKIDLRFGENKLNIRIGDIVERLSLIHI